jgi:hypothetical protein
MRAAAEEIKVKYLDVTPNEEILNELIATLTKHFGAGKEPEATAKIKSFRTLKQNWDSYNGLPISERAIEIALQLASVLPDWTPIPRSDGGIQFERGDDEVCIEAGKQEGE